MEEHKIQNPEDKRKDRNQGLSVLLTPAISGLAGAFIGGFAGEIADNSENISIYSSIGALAGYATGLAGIIYYFSRKD